MSKGNKLDVPGALTSLALAIVELQKEVISIRESLSTAVMQDFRERQETNKHISAIYGQLNTLYNIINPPKEVSDATNEERPENNEEHGEDLRQQEES